MKNLYLLKHKFLLCFFLIFFGGIYAQSFSNVKYKYSACPCEVKVTYNLTKAASGVELYYSPDTTGNFWLLATTFSRTAVGTYTDTWNCEAAGKVYGVFYYKLERLLTPCEKVNGVTINGVCWATRNVDAPGTFAAKPEDYGMLYQWDHYIGWNNTDITVTSTTSSPAGATWDATVSSSTTWLSANDPSPTGYCVPTSTQLQSLLDATNVTYVWVSTPIPGILFTDKNNHNTLFLPDAGARGATTGSLSNGGYYWSSTQSSSILAYSLYFSTVSLNTLNKRYGFSVRPVAKF